MNRNTLRQLGATFAGADQIIVRCDEQTVTLYLDTNADAAAILGLAAGVTTLMAAGHVFNHGDHRSATLSHRNHQTAPNLA